MSRRYAERVEILDNALPMPPKDIGVEREATVLHRVGGIAAVPHMLCITGSLGPATASELGSSQLHIHPF